MVPWQCEMKAHLCGLYGFLCVSSSTLPACISANIIWKKQSTTPSQHTHLKIQANICQTDTGETQEIGLHPQQNKSFTTLGIPFLSYGASQIVQW